MRILIIDDSIVSRRLIGDALSQEAEIETFTAPNGAIGLKKIIQQKPDLVTLDVEMPEMDGMETLKHIRASYPELPVIMVSRFTEQGAVATIDALFFGANDYVLKPVSSRNLAESLSYMRTQLLPKVKALHHEKPPSQKTPARTVLPQPERRKITTNVEILVIGSSTGGPNALAELLKGLPKPMPVPVLIAQHTLQLCSKHVAQRLSDKTGHSIVEARDGEVLSREHIYLAPGNQHLTLSRKGCMTTLLCAEASGDSEEPVPSVNRLFNSAASIYQNGVLAVVLTGMGRDGLEACHDIRMRGGQILVQDEESSVVWGMPGAVARAGLADEVLPLTRLAVAIMQRINS